MTASLYLGQTHYPGFQMPFWYSTLISPHFLCSSIHTWPLPHCNAIPPQLAFTLPLLYKSLLFQFPPFHSLLLLIPPQIHPSSLTLGVLKEAFLTSLHYGGASDPALLALTRHPCFLPGLLLFCSLQFRSIPGRCWVHNSHSRGICWMSKWMNKREPNTLEFLLHVWPAIYC